MKHLIKKLKFNNFNDTLSIDSTVIDGNLSFNRTLHCSIECLNQFINKIISENMEIDFYQELRLTEINEDSYYEFTTPQDFNIFIEDEWMRELLFNKAWKMIA